MECTNGECQFMIWMLKRKIYFYMYEDRKSKKKFGDKYQKKDKKLILENRL